VLHPRPSVRPFYASDLLEIGKTYKLLVEKLLDKSKGEQILGLKVKGQGY